jgi:uncharacterized LabA/DUF88 family protein
MKTIILIDGGFFKQKLWQTNKTFTTANDITALVDKICNNHCPTNDLVRIYYYDCAPLSGNVEHFVSKTPLDLSSQPLYKANMHLLKSLKRTDYYAVREGKLQFRGWQLKKASIGKDPSTLSDSDYKLDITQKGVDIKIGLDIVWIAFEHIAERILVVTGDSDMVPALKLARRNGIQVFLFTLGHGVTEDLKDHADVLITKTTKEFLAP